MSAITQEVTLKSLIPIETNNEDVSNNNQVSSVYEYEPSEEVILEELLNKNIACLLYTSPSPTRLR